MNKSIMCWLACWAQGTGTKAQVMRVYEGEFRIVHMASPYWTHIDGPFDTQEEAETAVALLCLGNPEAALEGGPREAL